MWGKRSRILGLGSFLGLCILGFSVPAGAVTRYVCPSGCEYSSIQLAIDASSAGDEVQVLAGTYYENINFKGKAIKVEAVDGPEHTTINGQANGRVVTFKSGEGRTTELAGFTIFNGSAPSGAGIYCNSSSPAITDCNIMGNQAIQGGGIYCYNGSSPLIAYCTISGNKATSDGGGIFCGASSSKPEILYCRIMHNEARWGGGIYCSLASPSIKNTWIGGNTASGDGGGICCYNFASPTITNCLINGNSTSTNGGGIKCAQNCLLTITNCTISRNTAGGGGGGITGDFNCKLNVVNSIIWDNQATWTRVKEIFLGNGSTINITYSDIQGGWSGNGNINEDPKFLDLQILVAGLFGDYSLQADSPCIDKGTNDKADYPALPDDDIAGRRRPVDGDGDGIAQYDMGAYEYCAYGSCCLSYEICGNGLDDDCNGMIDDGCY